MPAVSLDTADAVELAELPHFLGGWLDSDGAGLEGSLRRFVGTAGYDVAALRRDLARFTFLLGGDDGDALFTGDCRR